ncbi:MAG: cell division topological specificity factor MinE [Anaerolineae bacterium]
MRLRDIFRRKSKSSQEVAAERLRLVLTHDRANISPGMLEVLKDEIISVISKHLDIETDKVVVSFTEDTRETRLMADIPIHSARSKRAATRDQA